MNEWLIVQSFIHICIAMHVVTNLYNSGDLIGTACCHCEYANELENFSKIATALLHNYALHTFSFHCKAPFCYICPSHSSAPVSYF